MDKAEVPGELVQLPEFDNPRVQIAYRILCDTDLQPPPGEHWEGFAARHIVAALSPDLASPDALKALEDWLAEKPSFRSMRVMVNVPGPICQVILTDFSKRFYSHKEPTLAAAILAALEASK